MPPNFRTLPRAAFVAATLACGVAFAQGGARGPRPSSLEHASVAQLESAFWLCDYVATNEGVTATPRMACRYVTEELKRQKFGGDFDRFIRWWRDNKTAEYARIEHAPRS